jgi:tRNA-Thr(GGU) m(6)t(6)A37 methyltransferase TsaA
VSAAAPPFAVRPIGVLRTPWQTTAECPRNGRRADPPPLCYAELLDEFAPGLYTIEGYTHLIVLYWLDRAGPVELVFKPPRLPDMHGVFATRTPRRPNPIGLSVVRFEGLDGPGRLKLRYLDCVDGTPLIDIKPYLRTVDCEPEASMGFQEPRPV